MARVNDILLDASGDLLVTGGDFVIGPALEAQIEHLMLADRGAYRDDPLVGTGVQRMINGRLNSHSNIVKQAKLQLQGDGWQNIEVSFTPGQELIVNADRT